MTGVQTCALSDLVRAEAASIPLRRIVRYAFYALAVALVGWVAAGGVRVVADLLYFALLFVFEGDVLRNVHRTVVGPTRRAIRLFSLLVAVGVFLSQFERRE